jgi:PAS domain S-box-containing protein
MNALELAERLAEERERVDKAIVSNCPIPVFTSDKDGKWLSINEPFARLLAVGADDLLAMKWQRLLAASESVQLKKAWLDTMASDKVKERILFKFSAADGRQVQAWASLIKVDLSRWLGFMVPICITPTDCPLHHFLLHNLEESLTQVHS